ncbi:MAG: putative DNA-binding transcriptional regulator AlpA [Glaciecola sp.]|jgi:predicted DNA-binding transcriptional regulator AlpA
MTLRELNKTKEVAEFLNVAPQSLRISRLNGKLLGTTAPKHIKVGRTVFYKKKDIQAWLDGLDHLEMEA